MRTLSARLKRVESANTAASSSISASAPPTGLKRILDQPQSPSYVGPTSAEFGLDQRAHRPFHDEFGGHEANSTCMKSEDDDGDNNCPVAQSPPGSATPEKRSSRGSLQDLGLEEALRLVQVYEDTVGIMYPCVDLASVRTYAVEFYHSQNSIFPRPPILSSSISDRDWFHARDIQILKILLATALLVETHGQSERAAELADSVEDLFASRLKVAQVDMKECMILTLLVRSAPLYV